MPKKVERGALLDLLTYIPLQNIKKLEEGTLWRQKIFGKKSHSVEKNSKGGPLGTLGCVCFVEKVKK